jgi:hypothetical protein
MTSLPTIIQSVGCYGSLPHQGRRTSINTAFKSHGPRNQRVTRFQDLYCESTSLYSAPISSHDVTSWILSWLPYVLVATWWIIPKLGYKSFLPHTSDIIGDRLCHLSTSHFMFKRRMISDLLCRVRQFASSALRSVLAGKVQFGDATDMQIQILQAAHHVVMASDRSVHAGIPVYR